MITTTLRRGGMGPFVVSVDGIPRGIMLDADYMANQLRRFARWCAGDRRSRPLFRITFARGARRGSTGGSRTIVRFSRQVRTGAPHADVTRHSADAEIVAGSVVRKFLEDAGIFTGSHVVCGGVIGDPRRMDREIAALTRTASCAAYKVTEEADMDRDRCLPFARGARRSHGGRSSAADAFELLVTGIPRRILAHPLRFAELKGRLRQTLSSLDGAAAVQLRLGPDRHMLRLAVKLGTRAGAAVAAGRRRSSRGRLNAAAASILGEAVIQIALANALLDAFGPEAIDILLRKRRTRAST